MKRLWYILPVLVVLMIIVFNVQPYLQMNQPTNQGVLIVEGWMPHEYLPQVESAFRAGYYNMVVVTGTIRPFAYYLKNGETVVLSERTCDADQFEISVAGVPGSRLSVFSGSETLLNVVVEGQPTNHDFNTTGSVDTLVLRASADVSTIGDPDLVFVKSLHGLCGDARKNAHEVFSDITRISQTGEKEEGSPTYGYAARDGLVELGIHSEDIVVVPARDCMLGGRTKCNARAFADHAKEFNLRGGDLLTLGVHARRSFLEYDEALENFQLGVISLDDSTCTRSNWWRNRKGPQKILKEISGLLFGASVELTEQINE